MWDFERALGVVSVDDRISQDDESARDNVRRRSGAPRGPTRETPRYRAIYVRMPREDIEPNARVPFRMSNVASRRRRYAAKRVRPSVIRSAGR